MVATSEQAAEYWAQYDYTKPIAAALEAELGVEFTLWNTGGGCICLGANLEGGYEILIGSGVDGPLLRSKERNRHYHELGRFDGYGIGVYDQETGAGLAYAADAQATAREDVVNLLRRALNMAATADAEADVYPAWRRDVSGNIAEYTYLR